MNLSHELLVCLRRVLEFFFSSFYELRTAVKNPLVPLLTPGQSTIRAIIEGN